MTDRRADLERAESTALASYASSVQEVIRVGGVTLLRAPDAPRSPMLNRVVGLGVAAPATEREVDHIARSMAGLRHFVAVAPHATPLALTEWLAARGYRPDWGWMLFTRGVDELVIPQTTVEVVRVDAARAGAFARIVSDAYGLPEALRPTLAAVSAQPGWHCFLAEIDAQPISAAAMFVREHVGYLGFAATVAEQRGRGGQGALLAARIRLARQLGCDLLVSETGERVPERPSISYRNLLRAGFREGHVTANWLRDEQAVAS